MPELHVICVGREHLACADRATQLYTSGYWPVSEAEAERLVGGTIFLHETKKQPAYFGGTVLSYAMSDEEPHVGQLVFAFSASQVAKGALWRGQVGSQLTSGGVVD